MTNKNEEDRMELAQLKAITEALPAFPGVEATCHQFTQHKMTKGTSLSWSLKNTPETSAADWFNTNGTVFSAHSHKEREWIIIYHGSMILETKEEKRILKVGDHVVIEPGQPHSATFTEDCWYYAITVPRCQDWPI